MDGPGNVLLENVVLHGSPQTGNFDSLAFGDGDVHRQQDRRRGVDGHAGGYFVERDFGEQLLHVVQAGNRNPHFADLAGGDGIVRVVADLRGQVEGDR